jgi:hypothetical protein
MERLRTFERWNEKKREAAFHTFIALTHLYQLKKSLLYFNSNIGTNVKQELKENEIHFT